MEQFVYIFDGRYLLSSNGYLISQIGIRKGHKIYGTKDTMGYIVFGLLDSNNKHVKRKAHRLIAENFISNPDNKPIINHKNGIKSDNSISNLEWCTNSENLIHSVSTLCVNKATVLSIEDVLDIRKLHKKGHTIKSINKIYNKVKYVALYKAAVGMTWKHI